MSATSNKPRLIILLMAAIALVFFVTSFLAATLAGEPQAATNGDAQAGELAGCMVVRTGEAVLADCSLS
jgi:hypothetical protein